MKTKEVFALMALLLFNLVSLGQTYKLNEFVKTNLPKVSSPEWFNLNYSNHEFEVRNNNGILQIIKAKNKSKCELRIPRGTLIGTDNGEWGGKLVFSPNNKTEKENRIKEGNIKSIFYFNNKIYFAEGLAHLSNSEGTLYELEVSKNNFKYKKVLEFEDAPIVLTIFGNRIFIAAHSSFYIVQNLKKELVFKNTFWTSLYPNSIAALNERNVYLGIRGGIIKLDLITKTMTFYKYKQ